MLRDGRLAASCRPGDDPNMTIVVLGLQRAVDLLHRAHSGVVHWYCRAIQAWSFFSGEHVLERRRKRKKSSLDCGSWMIRKVIVKWGHTTAGATNAEGRARRLESPVAKSGLGTWVDLIW